MSDTEAKADREFYSAAPATPGEGKTFHFARKVDVMHALANAIMRLGKGDWEGTRWNIEKARRLLDEYTRKASATEIVERGLTDQSETPKHPSG